MGSLTGNLTSPTDTLRGRISSPGGMHGTLRGLEKINGYSAYQVAVINGFEGTEEEWLASLKGENGHRGPGIWAATCSFFSEDRLGMGFETNASDFTIAIPEGYSVQVGDLLALNGSYLFVLKRIYSTSYGILRYVVEDTGFSIRGPKGDKGDPGVTPVRGTDYWTEADKAEMVNSVIAALPVYEGEVESV